MGINKFQGTSWHVEKMHREEGDDRRHRSRCKYYDPVFKLCYGTRKCIGSSHCNDYFPINDDAFRDRQMETAEIKKLLVKGYTVEAAKIVYSEKKRKALEKDLERAIEKKRQENGMRIENVLNSYNSKNKIVLLIRMI